MTYAVIRIRPGKPTQSVTTHSLPEAQAVADQLVAGMGPEETVLLEQREQDGTPTRLWEIGR